MEIISKRYPFHSLYAAERYDKWYCRLVRRVADHDVTYCPRNVLRLVNCARRIANAPESECRHGQPRWD